MDEKSRRRYGWRISILFMAVWGTAFWDRLIISQASEVIMRALDISVTQFSALTALSTASFAVSSVVIGLISDRKGMRKRILIPLVAGNAILSLGCALSRSYGALLALRIGVGVCQGPMLVLMMSMLAVDSYPGTFGRNAGITAAGVAVFANFLGPIATTRLASAFGWHTPFFASSAMLLIYAVLIGFLVREVSMTAGGQQSFAGAMRGLFANRNFRLCTFIGAFTMVGYWSTQLFAPIYLTDIMGLSTVTRGTVSSVMGFIFIFTQLLVPGCSDRLGRKPALAGALLLGLISPLGMWLLAGSGASVVLYCVFGGLVATTSALFGNVIVMESLPDSLKASASGIVMGIAELVGGTVWPLAASSAEQALGGVTALMAITAALFLLAAGGTFCLKETSPTALARRKS